MTSHPRLELHYIVGGALGRADDQRSFCPKANRSFLEPVARAQMLTVGPEILPATKPS